MLSLRLLPGPSVWCRTNRYNRSRPVLLKYAGAVVDGMRGRKGIYIVDIAAADLRRISLVISRRCSVMLNFSAAPAPGPPGNGSDLLRFQLGVAAGDNHHGFGGFALDPANELPAFFVGVLRNRTGIDDVYIGHFVEVFLFKAVVLEQPANGGGFREIQLQPNVCSATVLFIGAKLAKSGEPLPGYCNQSFQLTLQHA